MRSPRYPNRRPLAPSSDRDWSLWAGLLGVAIIAGFAAAIAVFIAEQTDRISTTFKAKAAEIASLP